VQLNHYAIIAVCAIFDLRQITVQQERHFVTFNSRSTTVQHEVKSLSSTYRVQQELGVSNVLYRVQLVSNQGFIYSRNFPKGMLFTHVVNVTTLIVCFEKRAGVAGASVCFHP